MDKQADLRKWFKERWVDISRKKKGGGHPECGRDDADSGGGYPKCRPAKAAARMSKKQKTYAVRTKRSKPQGVNGKPTMVATFKKKAMFNPEVNNILETLQKEAKKPGPLAGTAAGATVGGALGAVGGAVKGYRQAGKDGKKGTARAKATAKGAANRAVDGVVIGGALGAAADVGRAGGTAVGKGIEAVYKKTMEKKASFNPEVDRILENLEKEALEVGAQRAMQQLGQGIKSSASELSDMQKKMNRQEGTMKGLNAAALGAGIGGGAALLALRHRKKKQEAAKKAEKAMEKKASFNPEVDRILDNLEKKASLRGVGVAAKRMMGPSGRKMMRSGMANPVRTAAAAGATLGAVRGAVKPGTNEDGTKKSRLSGMARGAAAGGVLGAGAGYGASKIK
jgi:hypothetical protein